MLANQILSRFVRTMLGKNQTHPKRQSLMPYTRSTAFVFDTLGILFSLTETLTEDYSIDV